MNRLVVISNRVGPLSDEGKAGGLAVGLADALRKRGGVWFGWSGKTSEEGTFGPLQIKSEGDVQLVTVDMTHGRSCRFLQRLRQSGALARAPLPHGSRRL